MIKSRKNRVVITAALVCSVLTLHAAIPDPLPDPDGKPADMSKKVKVFILLGQSNMLGFGKTAQVKAVAAEKYPYLVDEAGNWTVRKDVRNVRVMASGNSPAKDQLNDWLSAGTGIDGGKGKNQIGPEIGIGYYVGEVVDAPVMILKACIGNRSLGWDLLPPGTEAYEHGGKLQAGYRGTGDNPKGDTGGSMKDGWYAGCQYDGDTAAAKKVLENLDKYYPGAKGYEVAGFCFWQGAKDGGNAAHKAFYEKNLVQLIKSLRKDFDAPNAPFVVATLGHEKKGAQICDAQLAVDGTTGKYPEFKGNVRTFYSNPVCKGGSANSHYGGNGETYMNVGEGMGKLMAELLISTGTATSSGSSASGGAKTINTGDVKRATDRGYRIWTDIGGRKLSASLLEVKDGKAVLKANNGSTMPVPLDKLSDADNVYIDSQR